MMLLCIINSHCFAQASPDPEKIMEVQRNLYRRSFFFDLGKKEKMQIEVYKLADLSYLLDIDSIIEVFIKDLAEVKDSIPDAVYSRTIEYTIDGANMKRLSFSKHRGEKTSFVFTDGEASLLKLEQDTIVIIGIIPEQHIRSLLHPSPQPRLYRISLFLNDLDRLSNHRGHLNTKLRQLATAVNGKWVLKRDGYRHPVDQPSISSISKRGYTMGGDIVSLRPGIDIQNYKSWFVPSFTAGIVLSTNKDLVHREYGLGKESHFIFVKNDNGQSKAYLNMFVTLSYGQSNINPYTKKSAVLYPFISIGYLLKRQGEFYNKHTFKLAMGQFNLFANYTKIEPVIYFHDFMRACSPSLRITQHF